MGDHGEPWRPFDEQPACICDRDGRLLEIEAYRSARIIECVNACAGVDNLPQGIVRELHQALITANEMICHAYWQEGEFIFADQGQVDRYEKITAALARLSYEQSKD